MIRYLPLLLTILLLAGCSSTRQSGDTQGPQYAQINYSNYDTFAFGEAMVVSPEQPEFRWLDFSDRVREELKFRLPSTGLDYTTRRPDLLLFFYSVISDNDQKPFFNYQLGPAADRFLARGESFDKYGKDTFVLDMVDVNRQELVWRGSTKIDYSNRDAIFKQIPVAVEQLLRNYPFPAE